MDRRVAVSKTTYLTNQAKRAAKKFGSDAIGACSFTRSAAEELVSRLPVPDHAVGTLHALAYRALGSPPLTEDNDFIDEWNKNHPDMKRHRTSSIGQVPSKSNLKEGDKFLRQYQIHRAKQKPVEAMNPQLKYFVDAWEEAKQDDDRYDFTDLIETAIDEIDKPPGNPDVFLIDEAQDLTALEMELAKKWSNTVDTAVFCGDPFQTLYQFRGSEPNDFMEIIDASDHITRLDQSYRVPRRVQKYAENWIIRIKQFHPDEWIDREYDPKDEQGEVNLVSATYKQPARMLMDIKNRDGTKMILASCSYMLSHILSVMRDNGMTFHNPYNRKRSDWNPLSVNGTSTVDRVRDFLKIANTDADFWDADEFHSWAGLFNANKVFEKGAKTTIQWWCEEETDPRDRDMDDIFQKRDFLFSALEGDTTFLKENLLKNKTNPASYALKIYEKHGYEGLDIEPDVKIGTIHSVKGGEADHVYVMPDVSPSAYENWINGEKSAVLRQFYVAFTRAKKSLNLLEPQTSNYVEF